MPTIDSRTQVSLYKAIERYGHLSGDRLDTEATAADIMRDFIVIPRSDLPNLAEWEIDLLAAGSNASSDEAYASALHYLVVSEHLRAKEAVDEAQVDEAQVDALTDLIVEADGTESVTQKLAIRHVARRLVAAGVRAPQAGDDQ